MYRIMFIKRINRFYIMIFLMALLSGHSPVYPQATPVKMDINPLNRVSISFSSEIPEFSSALSRDKKLLTIKIPSAGKQGNKLVKTAGGIIKQAEVKKLKDTVIVIITLAEARGYNAYPLPYSNTLVVEVFKWNDLSKAEDFYRQGLLAYESRILAEAQSFFDKASAMNNPNANFFSGLMAILEEEFKEAEGFLLKAESLNSNIPDLYAALSYIYDMKNDGKKAEFYKKKFKSLTGIANIKEIPSNYFSQETEQSEDEPVSLLDQNSSEDTTKIDTAAIDTSAKAVTQIKYSNDTTPVLIGGDKKQETFLPEWMNSFTFYAVGIGLAFLLILISSYMKWRNNKLKYLKLKEKSNKNDAFSDNLKKAEKEVKKNKESDLAKYQPKNKVIQSQAANLYKKAESQAGSDIPDKLQAGPPKPVGKPEAKKEKETLEQQLEKLADKLEPEISTARAQDITQNQDEITFENEKKQAPAISPSFQLALHLHEEQEKLRKRNIESIDSGIIPEDRQKLTEFARKLGIDKGSVSVKKELSSLEADKELINSLYKKFAGGKKDNPD